MSLCEVIEQHDSSKVALIAAGQPVTYGELASLVAEDRSRLASLGIGPGDRVVIACGNTTRFVRAYLAILGLGAIAVPLNPLSPASELAREIEIVEPKAVLVGPAAAASMASVDLSVLGAGSAHAAPGVEVPGFPALPDPGAAAPIATRADTDDAVLLFTSGTAGSPKAARLTHGNLMVNHRQVLAHADHLVRSTDVVLCTVPLFHIFGLNGLLGLSLVIGATVVIQERFDPVGAVDLIEKHRVTTVMAAPPVFTALAAIPDLDPTRLSSVRLAVSGAAPLTVRDAEVVFERLGLKVFEAYGLTEAAPAVTSAAATDAPAGSIGIPLPGVELRLVDDAGEDVLIGDVGEIWVRGPNVFAGYWQDPDATAAAIDGDGWLHTGDLGVVDDDGYLFIVDRMKDLIIVSGFNVFPAEVEGVLALHPSVAEAAVVGVAHPYTGEAVKAFVVLEPGASIEHEQLIAHCAEHLAGYKCPSSIAQVSELPYGPTGKVTRRNLS